jgi:hypothetical protein
MALTLIPAASGHGVLLRDTMTRSEVYISEQELLEIGSALIRSATERPRRQPRRDKRV